MRVHDFAYRLVCASLSQDSWIGVEKGSRDRSRVFVDFPFSVAVLVVMPAVVLRRFLHLF